MLGNCGVGFAPVRPADHEQLIDMMEGVEDIPGAALTDGMPWGEWETFADYLDVLDRRRYAADVAVPHRPRPAPLLRDGRAGLRRPWTPRPTRWPRWPASCEEAFDAGAAGFSSNRFRAHMSRSGKVVPGTFAPRAEIGALAAAVGQAGHGVIQAIADGTITPGAETDEMPELDLLAALSIESRSAADLQHVPGQQGVGRLPPGARRHRRVERAGRAAAAADHPAGRHVHDEPRPPTTRS